jgi:2'-5' RNA ligase
MTTIIAPTPFVGRRIEEIRYERDWSASLGVPAHITLLGPFLHPDSVGPGIVARLAQILARYPPPVIRLEELRLVDDVACLIPTETEALAAISRELHEAWPQTASHGGLHHVTIARDVNKAVFETLQAELSSLLPLKGSITEAHLLERRGTAPVRTIARLELA